MSKKNSVNRSNPNSVARKLRGMVAGLQSSFPSGKTLELLGSTVSPSDAAAKVTATLVPFNAADSAKAAWKLTLHDREAMLSAAVSLASALDLAIRAVIGTTNPELEAFGLKPRVEHPDRTAANKAEAADKALATRKEHEAALSAKPVSTPPSTPGKSV